MINIKQAYKQTAKYSDKTPYNSTNFPQIVSSKLHKKSSFPCFFSKKTNPITKQT